MKFRSVLNQIAKDNIEDVFKNFDFFFKNASKFKNELIVIQGDLSLLNEQKRLDIIGENDYSLGRNKIRKSILDIFTQIEVLIEDEDKSVLKDGKSLNKSPQSITKIVQTQLENSGYDIIKQIHSDQSSYYFKGKKNNSFIQNDLYVIQVLNWYKLSNPVSDYNQKYLNFFSKCPNPFVDILEFQPGNPSYLIRRYINGIDLNKLIKSGIKVSVLKALEIIISISEGLKELKNEQIFYNNLIPDQIIMDNNGYLHILPLNVFEENINIITWKHLKDGVKYMSPEQLALTGNKLAENTLTTISNQFTLGLIFFYIMNGEPIFDGKGLPDLYEDRINAEDTKNQLAKFYDDFKNNLIRYNISKEVSKELTNEFIEIYQKLIQHSIEDRYKNIDDLISKLNLLRIKLEQEKKPHNGQFLFFVSDSFYRTFRSNDNLLANFYENLSFQIPPKKSIDDENERNIRFLYSMDYLFNSISNLENDVYVEEALYCLVKEQHFDFSFEEFEILFNILKENVLENDSECNEKIEESWNVFINTVLDSIEKILMPLK